MATHEMRSTRCRFLLALCLAGTTACAVEPPSVPPEMQGPAMSGLESVKEAALVDAAKRTGVSRNLLEVISAEAVTWSDGSLGCPMPGMMYTQALVPGFRVRVRAAGKELDYHAGRTGAPALCPAGRAIPPTAGDERI
jgi:hypothetical protein